MPRRSPPVQVRERLERQRRHGVDFDTAWRRALTGIDWHGGRARAEWLPALEATMPTWRSAYERDDVPDLLILADRIAVG